MKKLIVLVLALSALSGCTSMRTVEDSNNARVVPEGEVVLVDPTDLEIKMHGIDTQRVEYTPDHVIVGQKDGVTVEVFKTQEEWDVHLQDYLQHWLVSASNMTPVKKCITPVWQLMDFEYTSFGPTEQLIPANGMKTIGEMKQKIWELDGVKIAPAPSGYLHTLRVRDALTDVDDDEACLFLVPEEDIQEEPDVEM